MRGVNDRIYACIFIGFSQNLPVLRLIRSVTNVRQVILVTVFRRLNRFYSGLTGKLMEKR